MIPYGSRLFDLKKEVVRYITEKVKEGHCRNIPGDIKVIGERCFVVHTTGPGTIPLDQCSMERICNIADKLHFERTKTFYPVGDVRNKNEVKKEEPVTTQTEDMAFEIKNNIPLPGYVLPEVTNVEKKSTNKQMNYRSLPLKDMRVGDCIIMHECDASTVSSKFQSARSGIDRFVNLMDTKKKFKVAKTDDHKVGVWRVE